MKIEERIKQNAFRNEYHKLLANLSQNYSWINFERQKLFKKFDLTFQQFNLLCILRGQYPQTASVSLIKERLVEQNSDASRIVDRLVRKKLVQRSVCPKDRRQVDVLITQKGIDLLSQLDRCDKAIDEIVSHVTEEDARKLNELLDKLRK